MESVVTDQAFSNSGFSEEVLHAAQILWDYMRLNQPLEKADAIIVLGSNDTDAASYAAKLYHQEYAPVIVMSGDSVKDWRDASLAGLKEAEAFARIALEKGVPEHAIIVENKASNTSENLWFSEAALQEKGFGTDKLILIQQPFSERRVCATAKHRWPNKNCIVTTSPVLMADHFRLFGADKIICLLVGELQRLEIYRGIHVADEIIDPHLWPSFDILCRNGFTTKLVEPYIETLKRVKYA